MRGQGSRGIAGGASRTLSPPPVTTSPSRRRKFASRCRFAQACLVVSVPVPAAGVARRKTMRVMVFAKATEDSEQGVPPTAEAFAAMDRFTEELVAAGVLVAGAGLKSSAHAKRVTVDGARRTVTDGPFAETRELIAGFSIWEVKDMDEALAWATRCPSPMAGPSAI